jgi:peroxiredoxin
VTAPRPTVAPGQPAPALSLPAVNRPGTVSLADYRGASAVLLTFFRGLYCSFCRRHMDHLGAAQPALRGRGVEILAVVNTPLERAQVYLKHRPMTVTVLADPEAVAASAFGVPRLIVKPAGSAPGIWPETTMEQVLAVMVDDRDDPSRPPRPAGEATVQWRAEDGYEMTPADEQNRARHKPQLTAHVLVDRDGIVRWTHVEARDRLQDLFRLPSGEDLLAATRTLPA